MKAMISTSMSVLIALFGAGQFAAAAQPTSREVNIAVHEVFVPEVVDKNTDAKIVLSGMFPNSCYRWSRVEVTSREATFHQIKAMAFVTVNTMCLMVLVPFSKEVNLGQLDSGEHTLRFVSGDETYFEKKLIVR